MARLQCQCVEARGRYRDVTIRNPESWRMCWRQSADPAARPTWLQLLKCLKFTSKGPKIQKNFKMQKNTQNAKKIGNTFRTSLVFRPGKLKQVSMWALSATKPTKDAVSCHLQAEPVDTMCHLNPPEHNSHSCRIRSQIPRRYHWQPSNIQGPSWKCVSVNWEKTWCVQARKKVFEPHCSPNVLYICNSDITDLC